MSQKPVTQRAAAEKVVKEIRRATRKQHSAEEKIRIVLAGLRGEDSIAELCRREGIAQSLYYSWSGETAGSGEGDQGGFASRRVRSSPGRRRPLLGRGRFCRGQGQTAISGGRERRRSERHSGTHAFHPRAATANVSAVALRR